MLAGLAIGGCRSSDDAHVAAVTKAPVKPQRTASGQAVIAGRVFFSGTPPAPRRFRVSSDKACGAEGSGWRESESLQLSAGGSLLNAFVYVRQGLEGTAYAPPDAPAVLDQEGCRFIPHVLGLQVGQPLRILNSDPTLHNVHALSKLNRAFNLGLTRTAPEAQRAFDRPEVMIPVRCNVHPWMEAYLGVLAHPYFAVSDSAGRFMISHLPAGSFTVEVWHEVLGTQSQTVTLGETDSSKVEFTFPASALAAVRELN